MLRSKLFRGAFVGLVVLWAFHMLGIHLFLYWQLWWYDIPMHILGGFVVGLAALWLGTLLGLDHASKAALWFSLSAVLLVGVLWEVFEYTAGLFSADDHVLDTTLDLVNDLLGAGAAYLLGKRSHG